MNDVCFSNVFSLSLSYTLLHTLKGGEEGLFMNYVCPIKLEFLSEKKFQSSKFLFVFQEVCFQLRKIYA